MGESSLDLLAHHEAGHAAVAHALGFRLKWVRIDTDADNGETALLEGEEPSAFKHALILLAGGRAEHALDPGCLGRRLSTALDEARLTNILSDRLSQKYRGPFKDQHYVDGLSERMDERLAAHCARLVRDLWPAIQMLAAELREYHDLTGERATAILSTLDVTLSPPIMCINRSHSNERV